MRMMQDILPRQTFKSAADLEIEQCVGNALSDWARANYLHIGHDDAARQKSRIDGLLFRHRHVVAFAEIKSSSYPFRQQFTGWITALKKVMAARELHSVVRVPVIIVVRFGCGTIAYVNHDDPFERVESWGRHDRNCPGDIETGARFLWSTMKLILDLSGDECAADEVAS
jgi:hypothetical protein